MTADNSRVLAGIAYAIRIFGITVCAVASLAVDECAWLDLVRYGMLVMPDEN